MRLGPVELIIIFLIVLLLFGGGRLARLGGDLGAAVRSFRQGMGSRSDDEQPDSSDTEILRSSNGTGEAN